MLSEIPVNIRLSVLIPATIFSPVSYNEVFGNTLSNTDVWTDQVATDRWVMAHGVRCEQQRRRTVRQRATQRDISLIGS
jgi:hypothetical protein